jgi:tetratricopeptide (TPR) repeat protein
MPMLRIGSFSLVQFAAFCAVLALACGLAPAATGQSPSSSGKSSANFETLAAKAGSAREAGRTDEAIRNYRAAVELRPAWEEGWWYLGTLLYDTDHFEDAIPALRRVVELDPKVGPAWAFLGLCQFETGDYPEAFTHLQSAKELGFSESPDVEKVALYHLGLLFILHGEFERATDLLASAFGPSQFTEQIKVALGLALLRAPILPAQIDPSKDALIHAAGETAVLIANREMDAVSRHFEQMLRDYPGTPYLHYQYGLALMAASQYQPAELQLREETRTTPRSALPWIALASLSAQGNDQRNDAGEALTAARQAVQLAPNSAAAYQALARALQGQNKHDEEAMASRQAQELAKRAVEVEVDGSQASRYALAHSAAIASASDSNGTGGGTPAAPAASFEEATRLAESARQAGRAEEAATWYQNALKLRSNWPEGWRQLGTIQYMDGRYPEAIAALQQSVALETMQADTWTLLGLSEFETKDYGNALIHLERGRALGFSGNAGAVRISRYHLALLLNRNGDFDRAIDLLIPAIGAGALSDEIQFAMGIALLRIPALPEQVKPEEVALVHMAGETAALLSESRYDKAFPIFEKMVSEYPRTPFLHYAYGDALASTSMYDEARTQLREEAKLNPASVLPYLRLASIELLLHQNASAWAAAKKAVEMSPESSEAHYLLGRSLLEQGDIPASIHELETARRFSPNSPKVHFNLARAYSRAERTAEAQQERAEFERLNTQLPGQQHSYGDRAARGIADDMSAPPVSK